MCNLSFPALSQQIEAHRPDFPSIFCLKGRSKPRFAFKSSNVRAGRVFINSYSKNHYLPPYSDTAFVSRNDRGGTVSISVDDDDDRGERDFDSRLRLTFNRPPNALAGLELCEKYGLVELRDDLKTAWIPAGSLAVNRGRLKPNNGFSVSQPRPEKPERESN
jgi:hypothetical protein